MKPTRREETTKPKSRGGATAKLVPVLSQSVEVDLGSDVLVGHRRRKARDGVVVVSASEDLVLHGGAVVHLGVEVPREIAVKDPVFREDDTTGSVLGIILRWSTA